MSSNLPSNLHLGTSSWSSKDWVGVFYPEGTPSAEFIGEYARHFHTVEIDSTWHHMPGERMIDSLNRRTPEGFIFSAKVPEIITHKKYLVDCDGEMKQFLEVMSPLGEKLGPLVLQFAYVAKGKDAHEYKTGEEFMGRLRDFLPKLSKDFRYVVEVRNGNWLKPPLLDLLRTHGVSLALTAYYTMPALDEMLKKGIEPLTSNFTFVRFIGHRKEIDELIQTKIRNGEKRKEFDELVLDRTAEMRRWIPPLASLLRKGVPAYIYFNNHYAGHAPASARLFERLWVEMIGT
ncbi:MAG: DUF72 domain-containing protein [Acidobacteriia bacterium]|nr:DUF72 domain-containing protein [Terriglobia bacterium]